MQPGLTIAVIVPVYNSSPHLRKCLDALAKSSETGFECIVVDDGSTDDSVAVAQSGGARVLSTGGRKGPACARNIGARAAGADVVLFIDSDVCVKPDTLARVSSAFQKDPALTALIGSYDDAPESPDFLSQYKNLMHCYVHQRGRQTATTFWSGCGAIRRLTFLEFSGFNEVEYRRPAIEDIELGYRLYASGCKIILDRTLVVKHLKRWTFWGLLKTDIRDRGIPWTELILRDRSMPNDLNLHLSQRVSVALVFLLLSVMMLIALKWRGYFLTPLLAILFIVAGRYWVEGTAGRRKRSVIAVVTLSVGAIAGLAYAYHMLVMIPLALLAYVLLFVRHRYSHRDGHSRGLILSFIGLYIGLAVLFAVTYVPQGWLVSVFGGVLLALVILNGQFYVFLAEKRGGMFAVGAIPMHLLYHFYNGISFLIGLMRHYGRRAFSRTAPRPDDQASSNTASQASLTR
jgi:glycosyltransferase involved in cell wall biosynthesis